METNTKGHVKIGSRGSKLALTQSRFILGELRRVRPDIRFELIEISTTGDRNVQISLDELGGEGVFVKELEEALLDGRIDIAVHSLKDMPTFIPKGLILAAVPQRVDPRDVLISRSGKLADLPAGAKLGSGSQRRVVQILGQRRDLVICGLRGNIDTRLSRVSAPDGLDGIVMAAAALVRLGLESRITEYLSPDSFVPAVGQGALGIEIRAGDAKAAEIVARLNQLPLWQEVTAERAFLKALGGGCRSPIAAHGVVKDGMLTLHGLVSDPAGSKIMRDETAGKASDCETLGSELAQKLISMGARSLLTEGRI